MDFLKKTVSMPLAILTLIVLGAAGLAVNFVSMKNVSNEPMNIPVYRKATYQVPDGIEPTTAFSTSENAISNLLYEGLFTVSKSLEIEPALLTSWQLDTSGTLYTFTLKGEIYFHDGTPVSTSDVVRTLTQLAAINSPVKLRYARIQDISVINDRTVRVRLRSPYPPFIALLAAPAAKIVKRLEGQRYPYGTGAFRFRTVTEANGHKVLVLDRYDKYHGNRPYIETLELVQVSEAEAIAGLKAGYLLDTALMPYLGAGKMTEGDRALEVTQPAAVTWILAFNTSKAPTSDEHLRKCLVNSFVREEFVRKFIPEQQVALGILPPTLMGSGKIKNQIPPSDSDCRVSSNATPLTLDYPQELNRGKEMCLEIGTYFVKTGIKLNCKGVPFETLVKNIKSASSHISFLAQTLDLPDVEYFMETFESKSPLNLSNYRSQRFDELLATARIEPDRQMRSTAFAEMDQDLFDHAVTLNISYAPHISYWNKCLAGIEVSIAGESYIDYSSISARRGCSFEQKQAYGQ